MNVHRPTRLVFIVATILAAAALISHYVTSLPIVAGNEFLVIILAFILLWLGVVLRGF